MSSPPLPPPAPLPLMPFVPFKDDAGAEADETLPRGPGAGGCSLGTTEAAWPVDDDAEGAGTSGATYPPPVPAAAVGATYPPLAPAEALGAAFTVSPSNPLQASPPPPADTVAEAGALLGGALTVSPWNPLQESPDALAPALSPGPAIADPEPSVEEPDPSPEMDGAAAELLLLPLLPPPILLLTPPPPPLGLDGAMSIAEKSSNSWFSGTFLLAVALKLSMPQTSNEEAEEEEGAAGAEEGGGIAGGWYADAAGAGAV